MGDRDAGAYIHTLQEKREDGETITRSDLVWLALCPIMGGDMPQKERIQAALELIKKSGSLSKKDKNMLEAVLYVLAAKFLDSRELDEVKEVMKMTQLGAMLIEEGRIQGKEVMLIEIIRHKLSKGFSPDSLAEFLDLDPVYVRKISAMILKKPDKTDLEIAQALTKVK